MISGTEEVTVQTVVDGDLEAESVAPADAYVIRNPGGELYCTSAKEFERRYVLAT